VIQIPEQLTHVRFLKQSPRGSVALVHLPGDDTPYVLREYDGDSSAYRKLLNTRCEHLPKILAISEHDNRTQVLEEYIDGEHLATRLEQGSLTVRQTRHLAIQLCRALTVLHEQGIVHRDIKPDNVILRNGSAVLVDFDAARLYEPGTSTDTQVLGTVGYAAPEQFGIAQSDMRTDIYALGVMLNVILTGQHPSAGRLAKGSMRRIIQRCTMMNPDDRFKNARHLMAALRFAPIKLWLTPALIASAAVLALIFAPPMSRRHPARKRCKSRPSIRFPILNWNRHPSTSRNPNLNLSPNRNPNRNPRLSRNPNRNPRLSRTLNRNPRLSRNPNQNLSRIQNPSLSPNQWFPVHRRRIAACRSQRVRLFR